MRLIADENVPLEYVQSLRGDGHSVAYSRVFTELGPGATDEEVVRYAERADSAVLSTDVKDFSRLDADVPVPVAPQSMTGGAVRRAVGRLESLGFDPSGAGPIWLSTLDD